MNKASADYIGWLLATNDRAVERAIICLYNRQTVDEKMAADTKHCNGRGFSAGDARKGTYMAKYILTGKRLSGQWLVDARGMAFKYIGQLVEEAALKLASQEVQEKKQQEEVAERVAREVAEEKAIMQSEAEECQE